MLLFVCSSTASAQRQVAVDQFITSIVSKIISDPNVGGWAWDTNRNGGYLLRMLMDVTGDGHPEVFVASTLESSKHSHQWHVFDATNGGTLRPYQNILKFASAWPFTENGQTSLVLDPLPDNERLRISDEKPYVVIRHVFNFPEISKTISYSDEEGVAKIKPPNPGDLPKLQAILLADYLTLRYPKWTAVNELRQDGGDCFYREEDKERAAKNTAFTPQVALSMIRADRSESPTDKEQAKTPPPLPEGHSLASPKSTSEGNKGPTTAAGESGLSLHWPAVTGLIVAVFGLIWLMLKRRKI